jgi:quercetin dioxygenase-like cupin family protein
VQETLAGLRIDREAVTDDQMAEIAQARIPSARVVHPVVRDGEALLFDGRVWHASRNDRARGARTALLLQYASADTPIPMPEGTGYVWPFQFSKEKRVPTILVSGSDRNSANRLVPPPAPPPEMITTLARSVALPLADDPVERWRAYPQFRGPTRTLAEMSCHISVLSAGHHPHPPHIHPQEELLIVLDGTAEIELAEDSKGTGSSRHALRPGMFSYYPAAQHHTIHCAGPAPATYLMFKWHAGKANTQSPLPTSIFAYDTAPPTPSRPIVQTLLFEQATDCLGKLHAHLTTLQPGGGYEPHADPYDVAIVLLSGEVETVGERVRPLGVIYYSAGELHGMKNVGATPATYLVFEFHDPSALKRRSANHPKQIARLTRQVERQRIKLQKLRRQLEKERRRRGLRGSIRSLVKAVRKLLR